MSLYGKVDFWNERYSKKTEPYDWYQRFQGVKDVITQYLDRKLKEDKILHIGAGTSKLAEQLYEEGFHDILNTDISTEVVKLMNAKYEDKYPGMKYVRDMKEVESESIDLIIDKGTFDTILCSEYSRRNAAAMLGEIYRTLKTGGTYICITYGIPEKRIPYFEQKNFEWKIEFHKVTKMTIDKDEAIGKKEGEATSFHYIYAIKKLQ